METLSSYQIIEAASQQMGKFIVSVINYSDFSEDYDKQPITIRLREINSKYSTIIIPNVEENFIFDSEEQAWEFYREFECPILSDSAVYASLCSPTQGFLTENC